MKRKGLVQIYTGNGKGKTTAAVGLAVRAYGHGLRVCYIYFHKDPQKWGYSEHTILKKIGIDVFGFAKQHIYCDKKTNVEKIREDCLKGLDFIKSIFRQKEYDILILDEINISLRDKFLKTEEVIELLTIKPAKLEIVLTGRGAPRKIIEQADLVSKIQKIKHPYDKGIKKREGIEY